ncbi:MAG TPA: DUF5049 domain-containing protein [Candidatus Hydrogenedentes bacterium]|nr:DUF5049 domain-containing protein [Candidatus Hydrogenedentota bacterium]
MNAKDSDPVPVPAAVFEGLQRCRQLGEQNMLEIGTVLRWLRDDGWYAAAEWVEQNQQAYLDAVIQPGFRPDV